MSDSHRRAFNRGDVAACNITVNLLEVDTITISEFPFHHQIAMDAVAEPSAHSKIVGLGLRNAQVVEKYANFDALLCKYQRRIYARQNGHCNESDLAHAEELQTLS